MIVVCCATLVFQISCHSVAAIVIFISFVIVYVFYLFFWCFLIIVITVTFQLDEYLNQTNIT